jgi:hypothetical protein
MNRFSKLSAVAVAALWVSSHPVFASSVPQIPASILGIEGSVKRMISYRDQNHSWQTSDGAIHIIVNLGSTPARDGLALYSSFDNGVTWTQMFSVANTDGASTDDGVLMPTPAGATLQFVYATSPNVGTIVYATAIYDSASQRWTLTNTQTAFSSRGIIASNPAMLDQGLHRAPRLLGVSHCRERALPDRPSVGWR